MPLYRLVRATREIRIQTADPVRLSAHVHQRHFEHGSGAILASQSAGWFHERAVFKALQELAGCLVDGEASARNRELEDL